MLDLANIFLLIVYMFIRQIKQKGPKGKRYTYHRLVETIRTDKGPRQRTILNLGSLSLPKEKWGALVKRIEANLGGQISFMEEDAQIESFAYYYAQRIQVCVVEEGEERVLYVRSDGKAKKERSMKSRFEQFFEEELDRLAAGLTKKYKTKRYEKVIERIGRLKEKYRRISSYYEITVNREGPLAIHIRYEQKRPKQLDEKYSGSYFLRTNRQDLDKEAIWHIYNLIRRIESSFESLKSHLGFRPIYHQKESRSDAHLFISVLAYHLLNSIEHRLRSCGDHRNWDTIRTILSNHTRVTVIQRDKNNRPYRVRINVTPNEEQSKIYRNLLVKETMLLPKLIPN
jgi:transposase